MSKKPYIPLYVGDWLKDTDCISLEAEGALLKFIFKMWESKTPGSLSIRFSQISLLLKKSEEISRKIIQELHENGILDIEFISENEIKIQSRRMIRENNKSLINSENGSKGGRPKKNKPESQKRIKSELKAKQKRNADNDIDIDIENDIDNNIKNENESGKINIENPEVFELDTSHVSQHKTTFRKSPLFNRTAFDIVFADWPLEKRNHYYEAALIWSDDKPQTKNQSTDWGRRIKTWDSNHGWKGDLKPGFNSNNSQNFSNKTKGQLAYERINDKLEKAGII